MKITAEHKTGKLTAVYSKVTGWWVVNPNTSFPKPFASFEAICKQYKCFADKQL